MIKGILRLRIKTLLLVACAAILLLIGAQGIAAISKATAEKRADVIQIDAMTVFGSLERSPVVFYHDKHTDAAKKMGKDCSACHLKPDEKSERLSIKYMRLKDADRETVMNIYHDNCIACHNDARAKNMKTGPVECNNCHNAKNRTVSSRMPVGMDQSLHYRHDRAMQGKCETCHHAYDAQTEKLFYDKGKEGTCRYCHGNPEVKKASSYRVAAHTDCVDCHRQLTAKKKDAGPVQCAGCHDAEEQAIWEQVKNVPRMKRGQPDVAMVDKGEGGRMGRVPFDHAAHERYSDTCRVCHHAEMAACNTCHTVAGKKEGHFVNLQKAMHMAGTDTSCLGCHDTRKMRKECAGCHVSMPKRSANPETCVVCHQVPPGDVAAEAEKSERAAIAAIALMGREKTTATYTEKDIPDVVVIDKLVNQYEAVKMPHRKIVNKMMEGIQNSQMTAHFHLDPGTLCQGCHHKSPANPKPPKCASCHSQPFDQRDIHRPGLKGAYHQQCMSCHEAMGIEKPANTDCVGCHIERKTW